MISVLPERCQNDISPFLDIILKPLVLSINPSLNTVLSQHTLDLTCVTRVLRMPWAAVAAATALVTLGGVDKSAYADLLPSQEPSLSGPNAAAAGDEGHLLSASSLSAPFLVFAEGLPSDSAATVPLETANTVDVSALCL